MAKHDAYSQLAEAKTTITEQTCRIEFLEKQSKKKDDRIRELELEIYDWKAQEEKRQKKQEGHDDEKTQLKD